MHRQCELHLATFKFQYNFKSSRAFFIGSSRYWTQKKWKQLVDFWHFQLPLVKEKHIFLNPLTPWHRHSKRSKPPSVPLSWQRIVQHQLSCLTAPLPCSLQANKYICMSIPPCRWAGNHKGVLTMVNYCIIVCLCVCFLLYTSVNVRQKDIRKRLK